MYLYVCVCKLCLLIHTYFLFSNKNFYVQYICMYIVHCTYKSEKEKETLLRGEKLLLKKIAFIKKTSGERKVQT